MSKPMIPDEIPDETTLRAMAEQHLCNKVRAHIMHGEVRAYTYAEVLEHMAVFAQAVAAFQREQDAQIFTEIVQRWIDASHVSPYDRVGRRA